VLQQRVLGVPHEHVTPLSRRARAAQIQQFRAELAQASAESATYLDAQDPPEGSSRFCFASKIPWRHADGFGKTKTSFELDALDVSDAHLACCIGRNAENVSQFRVAEVLDKFFEPLAKRHTTHKHEDTMSVRVYY